MTAKLYYKDAYLKNWETEIVEKYEQDGMFYLLLRETAFYPEGGGQPSDVGTIGGEKVLDVFLDGQQVIHKMERWPEEKNIQCEVDWEKRFDHMQQHSGQHLLSSVCLDLFGCKTVSFHLGDDHVTIDVETEELSGEQIKAIEDETNKRIYENRIIKSYFVTEEEMKKLPLVKWPKVKDNIRIVEIEGIEYNACGGTHLSRTGEIGMIKLLRTEKRNGAVRVYFKCGYRALYDYSAAMDILTALGMEFNTGRNDILDRVGKREQEMKKLESELQKVKEELDIYTEKELVEKKDGKMVAWMFEDKTLKDLQKLAAKLISANEVIVLFASSSENKVICMHNGSLPLSCGALFKEHLSHFNGRGGGKDSSAQAGFFSREQMGNFFDFMVGKVKRIVD